MYGLQNSLVVFYFSFLLTFLGACQPYPVKETRSDLYIADLFSSGDPSCPFDPGEDIIYMQNVTVSIGHGTCPGEGNIAGGTAYIKVSYYDLDGDLKSTIKEFSLPTVGTSDYITIINHPILAKKSNGITARIVADDAIQAVYFDCNRGNNKMTINMCAGPAPQ